MPYQIKAGSLTIVATNSIEALRVFESLNRQSEERVYIRDMDGTEIDPDRIKALAEPRE